MKKNLITILLVFLIPVIAYAILTFAGTDNTMSADANTNKPQIIKFTSTMCLDCQAMNKIIKELYPKYQDEIILTEINVQEQNPNNDKWIKKYNVSLVPTIILINSNGSQTRRIEGAIEKEQMEEYIRELR
ncbi:thioredoxin family protein [bacterium]|nr:thioredoxin family protein [bacterium]